MYVQGAHQLDLRGSDPADPVSVVKVRKQERAYIRSWIQEYHPDQRP